MSRLAKQAEEETNRRRRLRPVLLGLGAVVALLATIVASSRNTRTPLPPEIEITAGNIHVEGAAGEAQMGAFERVTEAHTEKSQLPVSFYEILGQGQDTEKIDQRMGAMDDRPLPLPPPAEEVILEPVAPVEAAPPAQAAAAPPTEPEAPEPEASAAREAAGGESPQPEPSVAEAPRTDPAPAPAEAAPAVSSENLPYTLQVASFSQQARAEELVARLVKNGFAAYLVTVDLGEKGTWWRVRSGHYATEHAAKWARLDLVKLGVSPIIVRD